MARKGKYIFKALIAAGILSASLSSCKKEKPDSVSGSGTYGASYRNITQGDWSYRWHEDYGMAFYFVGVASSSSKPDCYAEFYFTDNLLSTDFDLTAPPATLKPYTLWLVFGFGGEQRFAYRINRDTSGDPAASWTSGGAVISLGKVRIDKGPGLGEFTVKMDITADGKNMTLHATGQLKQVNWRSSQ